MSGFKKAQRTAKKVKMAIQGPSGGGKTYSGLQIATALVKRTDPGKRIAFIDTEHSADLYAPPFDFDVDSDFGEGDKTNYHPDRLIEKLESARKAGVFGVVIVDSLTHVWEGPGGFLAMHAAIGAKQKAMGKQEDTWGNWKFIDPHYNALWTYIRNYPLHVILCLRSEEKTERTNGKIEKQGLQAIFRKKWEFEVDIQFAVEGQGQNMVPLKHRLGEFMNEKVFKNPGDNVAEAVESWLKMGAPGQADEAPAAVPAPAVGPSVAKAVEEPPATERMPASEPKPPVENTDAADSLFKSLTSAIEKASSDDELKAAGKRVNDAKKDGLIDDNQRKFLASAFSAKSKSLKGQAAA